jgi:lipoprotein-anchoring transpeptidase ErfK/SrfK
MRNLIELRLAFLASAFLAPCLTEAVSAQPANTASLSVTVPSAIFSGKRSRQVVEAQVLLDRARFSPGVIDGYDGGNTRRAIEAYQRANGIAVTGRVDAALLDKLRSGGGALFTHYTITEADVAGPFVDVPNGMAAMAELDTLAYASAAEALAERFHMTQGFLEALNPQADFGQAGTQIIVVAAQEGQLNATVARIEVDAADSTLRAFAKDGRLLATFPATVGSAEFPSPSGDMTVRALAPEPKYYFSPKGREWGPERNLTIAAGPNNPVGSTWIDLSKEGYGIHGTPDPRLIGKTASHGCVRLTNWDARMLAEAVELGTKVIFL